MLRLVSFNCKKNAALRVGALVGGSNATGVIDLTRYTASNLGSAFQSAPQSFASHADEASRDMVKLIETGDETAQWLHRVIEKAATNTSALQHAGALFAMSDAHLAAPIPVPRRNLMCVGKNYKDHVAEVAAADKERGIGTTSSTASAEQPKYAQFFTKLPTTVTKR